MAKKLTPRERLPIAAVRFIRRTYNVPGKAALRNVYAFNWRMLNTPRVIAIERIPEHECTIDDRWGSNVYACCWGETHKVTVEYSTSGAQSMMGAHFDYKTDSWHFTVWMD
jgi:hypothetical protein